MKATRIALAAVVVAALAVTASFAVGGKDRAPSISYTLLDGTKQTSEQALKGKVVLVNFWATSCTTCVKEMPHIIETHQKYKDKGFETLAVAMSYDPPAYVSSFAESRQLPFKVAIDNTGEIARQYGQVQLTPTTFVLNRKGEIVKRYVGEPDFQQLHLLLEKLLAENA
ncbi:TlpA disulfide reductase family protein [Sphaerotilus uruguayifluvii]|uniref:Peroxiredoxin n=1 Tax=Sphaerotilus uruguayifluvii TaxID=2735897 RepID=A0ABX2FWS9_9BURK|nr:TlpA disulfide reductase family protein [Leptothrix sp. C29]NRT54491.1 peroxiredoxin [Leptothrix sp. C29]